MKLGLSGAITKLHHLFVRNGRADVLSHHLAELIPGDAASVLDIGCGDGLIDQAIKARRADLAIEGIDLFPRPEALIPVRPFDGQVIPFDDKTFDAVMLVDVLHHAANAASLLREATRVARKYVVIKDVYGDGVVGPLILRFMDLVGNAGHSFAWTVDYWPRLRWQQTFSDLQLSVTENRDELGLYPVPASWLFERSYHFMARLTLNQQSIPVRGAQDPGYSAGKQTG